MRVKRIYSGNQLWVSQHYAIGPRESRERPDSAEHIRLSPSSRRGSHNTVQEDKNGKIGLTNSAKSTNLVIMPTHPQRTDHTRGALGSTTYGAVVHSCFPPRRPFAC